MRLELEVIDGPMKGKRLNLRKGLLLGRETGTLQFQDDLIAEQHAVFDFDQQNSWYIECLAPNNALLGSVEQQRVKMIPGLIFHLGNTGFKVLEKTHLGLESWEEGLKEWIKENRGKQMDQQFF